MKLGLRSSVAASLAIITLSVSARADPPPSTEASPPAKHETAHELTLAAVPQPTPPPNAVPAPTPEEIRRRRVTVRIDSTRPNAVVERRTSVKEEVGAFIVLPFRAHDSTWEQVCVTPCEVDLDRFSTYRISAMNGISSSSSFTLPQKVDVLHLGIDTGSLVAHRAGQTMTIVGLSAVIVGASLLIAASDFRHPSDARIAGAVTGGSGIALAAVGLPLSILSTTHVRDDSNKEVARVYNNRGYAIPFLPDIKLSKTMTLTQRGIIF